MTEMCQFVADHLRDGSTVDDKERLLFLCKIMNLIHSYEHGGLLFIVPNDMCLTNIIDVKYNLPASFFGENKGDHLRKETARKRISRFMRISLHVFPVLTEVSYLIRIWI